MSQESVNDYFYGENDNKEFEEVLEEFKDYNPPLYGFEYDKTPDKDLFSPTDTYSFDLIVEYRLCQSFGLDSQNRRKLFIQ